MLLLIPRTRREQPVRPGSVRIAAPATSLVARPPAFLQLLFSRCLGKPSDGLRVQAEVAQPAACPHQFWPWRARRVTAPLCAPTACRVCSSVVTSELADSRLTTGATSHRSEAGMSLVKVIASISR